ncbi:hypothetical protein NIES2101_32955 [Calothrix sp. HK-06]|nr:hypothetical protein NIES2101_32955 [Calothrix sp. HK-06]
MGRKEIENMSRLSYLKHTKVYQEALREGEELGEQKGEQKAKLAMAPKLLDYGMTVEDVAEIAELEIEQVRQIASQKQ